MKYMQRNVEILGLKEMDAIMRELPSKVSYNLIISALRKAAIPVQQEAVSLAPVRKGTIKKSIVIKGSREQEPAVYIVPTKGRNVINDAWYAKFQEFGTKGFGKRKRTVAGLGVNLNSGRYYYKRKTTGYGKKGKGLPALEFMRRAADNKLEVARELINSKLSNVIVRYLKNKAPKYYGS
jgi:HK97 gp10 family phage protein